MTPEPQVVLCQCFHDNHWLTWFSGVETLPRHLTAVLPLVNNVHAVKWSNHQPPCAKLHVWLCTESLLALLCIICLAKTPCTSSSEEIIWQNLRRHCHAVDSLIWKWSRSETTALCCMAEISNWSTIGSWWSINCHKSSLGPPPQISQHLASATTTTFAPVLSGGSAIAWLAKTLLQFWLRSLSSNCSSTSEAQSLLFAARQPYNYGSVDLKGIHFGLLDMNFIHVFELCVVEQQQQIQQRLWFMYKMCLVPYLATHRSKSRDIKINRSLV